MNLNFAFPECFHGHEASLLQIPSVGEPVQCCFPAPAWLTYISSYHHVSLRNRVYVKPQLNPKADALKDM